MSVSPPDAAALNAELQRCIEAAAGGDVAAFGRLYDLTSGRLLSLVRRIAGDANAEDVLSETYLQVWRQLGAYSTARGAPLPWLVTIARSRALDACRRDRARHQALPECGLADVDAQPGPDATPEQRVSHMQLELRFEQAIAALLTPKERLVLGLAYFRDCSHSEIASLTGLPAGSVKTALRRSQEKLRVHFAPQPVLLAAATAPPQASQERYG